MKIMIFGYPGSGKSTAAKIIGEKLNYPILNTDKILFNKNWIKKDINETNKLMKDFIDNNESWIIEGNATNNLFEERASLADIIIFTNLPRLVCYRQAKSRAKYFMDKEREDRPKDCKEKFTLSFRWWILFTSRIGKNRKKYNQILKKYKNKVINIKSRSELDIFLKLIIDNNSLEELKNYERKN